MRRNLDDVLLVSGCALIVTGVALWSIPAALIAAGAALIGFGILVARKMAKNVPE